MRRGSGLAAHQKDTSARNPASAAESTERRGGSACKGFVYPVKQAHPPVDLRSDCETVPFSYRVHAMQHNERMLARSMGWKREEVGRLSRYQQARRFSGCRSADPADWLFACRPGSGIQVSPWLAGLAVVGDGFLMYDDERKVFYIAAPV